MKNSKQNRRIAKTDKQRIANSKIRQKYIALPSLTWNPPSPLVSDPVSGVMTTTGECAQKAAATPVTKLVIPGPFWAMQTPG